MNSVKNKKLAVTYLLFACFIAVLMDVISKTLMLEQMNPITIMFFRYLISSILFIIGFISIKKIKIKYKPNIKRELYRGVCIALASIAWTYGLARCTITFATLIVLTQPLFLIIFARIFLKEAINKLKISIMLVMICILVFITYKLQKNADVIGILSLICGTGLYCLVDAITKKIILENNDSITNTFYSIIFTTIPGFMIILYKVGIIHQHIDCNIIQAIKLLIIGILNIFCLFLFILAFKKADLNFLAIYKYSETIFGFIADYVIFSNLPNKITQLYGLCIIPASILVILVDRIKPKTLKSFYYLLFFFKRLKRPI